MTLKHSDILSWLPGLLLPLSSMQAVESHHASDSHDASERISVHAEKNIGSTGSSISRYYSTSWVQTGSDVALWFYLSFAMKLWSHKPSSVLIVSCYFHTGVDGSLISFLHFCKGNSFASNLDFFVQILSWIIGRISAIKVIKVFEHTGCIWEEIYAVLKWRLLFCSGDCGRVISSTS